MFLPIFCKKGLAASKFAVSPPTINVSVAASAPPTPAKWEDELQRDRPLWILKLTSRDWSVDHADADAGRLLRQPLGKNGIDRAGINQQRVLLGSAVKEKNKVCG